MTHPKAILVDIDGTLANITHRLHYVKEKRKNWKKFFEEMKDDSVNEWCRNLVYHYFNAGYVIIFMSGRPEDYRSVTHKFIDEKAQLYHTGYQLFMRPSKDSRKDSLVKEELYLTHIKDKYTIELVIDDRQQVVDKWRELGLVTLQCAKGDF